MPFGVAAALAASGAGVAQDAAKMIGRTTAPGMRRACMTASPSCETRDASVPECPGGGSIGLVDRSCVKPDYTLRKSRILRDSRAIRGERLRELSDPFRGRFQIRRIQRDIQQIDIPRPL